jgi:hypothetical protein
MSKIILNPSLCTYSVPTLVACCESLAEGRPDRALLEQVTGYTLVDSNEGEEGDGALLETSVPLALMAGESVFRWNAKPYSWPAATTWPDDRRKEWVARMAKAARKLMRTNPRSAVSLIVNLQEFRPQPLDSRALYGVIAEALKAMDGEGKPMLWDRSTLAAFVSWCDAPTMTASFDPDHEARALGQAMKKRIVEHVAQNGPAYDSAFKKEGGLLCVVPFMIFASKPALGYDKNPMALLTPLYEAFADEKLLAAPFGSAYWCENAAFLFELPREKRSLEGASLFSLMRVCRRLAQEVDEGGNKYEGWQQASSLHSVAIQIAALRNALGDVALGMMPRDDFDDVLASTQRSLTAWLVPALMKEARPKAALDVLSQALCSEGGKTEDMIDMTWQTDEGLAFVEETAEGVALQVRRYDQLRMTEQDRLSVIRSSSPQDLALKGVRRLFRESVERSCAHVRDFPAELTGCLASVRARRVATPKVG